MAIQKFVGIVLAAGHGTRMKSPLPKVLHPVAGVPMVCRVIANLRRAGATEVRVIISRSSEALIRQVVEPLGAVCFIQEEALGTANAVAAAKVEELSADVVIVNGDHPLITVEDIQLALADFKERSLALGLVTCQLKNPRQFGRVVRQDGELAAIVEAKDASPATLKINEVNTGLYVCREHVLKKYLPKIKNENAAKEFYLTDLIALTKKAGEKIGAILSHPRVAAGVNTQLELANATKKIWQRKVKALMEQGVIIVDPNSTFVEDFVEIGAGTILYPGVVIRGKSIIQRFCAIEPNCVLANVILEESVQIKAMSHLEEAHVLKRAVVGPFARLRPGAKIGEEVRIGNFVEVKNSEIGARSKANHLAYIGDAVIGTDTNFGCGAITVNYAVDHKKYKTLIGNNVFIGSDSQLVAPVTINDNSVVACGSTITKEVPAGSLAVARGKQYVKENYKPRSSDTHSS